MITKSDLHDLYLYQPEDYLVSSLYLDIHPELSPNELKTTLKSLTGEVRKKEFSGKTDQVRSSLEADLESFRSYLETGHIREDLTRSIALFSCSEQDFWSAFHVPQALGNKFTIDRYPYLRPLSTLLDQSHRTLTVLVDRGHARFCEIHLNKILSSTTMTSDIAKKVREGGFKGYDESKISRRVQKNIDQHLKQAATQTMDMFKREPFECLVIGGRKQPINKFQNELHSYLKDRVVGTFEIKPEEATDREIMERARPHIVRSEEEHEQTVLKELQNEVGRGGLGVYGLDETLEKLNQKQVRLLVVDHEFEATGSECPFCDTINSSEAGPCAYCDKLTQPVENMVDRMIATAIKEGGETEHIFSEDPKLKEEGVGALLYFK